MNHFPEKLTDPIEIAALRWGIDPNLIIAIIQTESEFKKYAKSSKRYHGYMQIPKPIYDEYLNIDIGTGILREKINRANGNIRIANFYYKGFKVTSSRGKWAVNRVMKIYANLKEGKYAEHGM
jgi:soluble lytic murein transglycosylase-like protein